MGEGYPILAIFGDTGLLFAYKQWGVATKEYSNGIMTWEYPITVRKVLKILTEEAYPTSWLQNHSVLYASISAASDNSIGLAMWSYVKFEYKLN